MPINNQVRYTLKQKYAYYKAMLKSGRDSKGKPLSFEAKVWISNELQNLLKRMGKNKRNFDFYFQSNSGGYGPVFANR